MPWWVRKNYARYVAWRGVACELMFDSGTSTHMPSIWLRHEPSRTPHESVTNPAAPELQSKSAGAIEAGRGVFTQFAVQDFLLMLHARRRDGGAEVAGVEPHARAAVRFLGEHVNLAAGETAARAAAAAGSERRGTGSQLTDALSDDGGAAAAVSLLQHTLRHRQNTNY